MKICIDTSPVRQSRVTVVDGEKTLATVECFYTDLKQVVVDLYNQYNPAAVYMMGKSTIYTKHVKDMLSKKLNIDIKGLSE